MENFAEIIKNVITSEDLKRKEKELSDRETDFKKKCEQFEKKKKEQSDEFEKKKKEHDPNKVDYWRKFWEDHQIKPMCKKEIFDLSERIMESNNIKFVTIRSDDRFKEMLMYKQSVGYYVPYGETYLHQECVKNVRTSDKSVVNQLVSTIQGKTYKEREDFIHPEHMVNLKNGVYDLNEKRLIEHDPKYYFQGVLGINFDKNATCPVWTKAIKGMFDDEEDCIRTQKWYGYHFTRENREQIAHGYFGESGSGKSKILMILRDLLGHKNVTNFELQDLSKPNTYSLGRLYMKYANINFDMSSAQWKDISNFKKVTSGDPIAARNIRESPFEYTPFAKLSLACNKLPYVVDEILETKEFQRRMMLTETHIGHETTDPDIYHKFRLELSGLFNWTVEGYKLYKEEGFRYDKNVASIWRENMDMRYAPKEQHSLLSSEKKTDDVFPKNVIKYD